MEKFQRIIEKAKTSSFQRWILNKFMGKFVPFNGPHKFFIKTITDDGFEIGMPYIRKNMNHLKGIHACGLATLCELTAGLTLMRKLGFKNYRLIMQTLEMEYFFQAKMSVMVKFELTEDWINKEVKSVLEKEDSTFVLLKVDTYDEANNHICTGTTKWQIKKWNAVKTKV